MSNNQTPLPKDSFKTEADKQTAELNSKLSLIDSIRHSVIAQKSQVMTDSGDQRNDGTSSQRTSSHSTSTRPAQHPKADGNQAETEPKAGVKNGKVQAEHAPPPPVTIVESHDTEPTKLASGLASQLKETSPASVQAQLANLDLLISGAEHESNRIRAAIGETASASNRGSNAHDAASDSAHQTSGFDLRLPQIELGSLKRQSSSIH